MNKIWVRLKFLNTGQLLNSSSVYSELLAHKFSWPVDFYSDEKVALSSFLEISINQMKFLKHLLLFSTVFEEPDRIYGQNLKF